MHASVVETIEKNDRDSVLMLLPGSEITEDGTEQLSKMSGFDAFIIHNRLKTALPHLLCPVNSRTIAGESGDLLVSAGIRFLAVRKSFLAVPFHPFVVRHCRFGEKRSQFYDRRHEPVELHNKENVLLLEGCYHTTDGKLTGILDPGIDAGPGFELKHRREKAVRLQDLKTCRFIMLYLSMDMNPLIFIDQWMDYTFLGPARKLTVGENLQCLRHRLQETFSRQTDQRMLSHGYALENDRRLAEMKTKKFRLTGGMEMATTEISNESAVNRMSRLIFFQWCRENGWVDRMMPAA